MTSFSRNVISNASAHALGSIIQFVLGVCLARWLTTVNYAAYVTAVALIGVTEMLSDFGLRIWAQRRFASVQGNAVETGEVFCHSIVVKVLFSLIFGLPLVVYPWMGLTLGEAVIAVCIAVTQPSTDPLLWFLRGRERLDIEASVLFAWRFVNALFIILAAWSGASIDMLLTLWFAINVARVFIESRFELLKPARQYLNQLPTVIHVNELLRAAKEAFPIGISFALMSFYHRLGVFLIGERGNSLDVAQFGAVFTLVASAGFVGTSITVSGFPALSRAIGKGLNREAEAIAYRKIKLIALIFLPACLVGMALAPGVITLLYPAKFFPAAEAMPMLLAALFLSIVNFAMKYILNGLLHNWWDAISAVLGILVFSLVCLLPRWSFQPAGAAFAWCAAEMAVFVVKAIVLKVDGRLSLPILPVVGMVFLFLWCTAWFSGPPIMDIYRSYVR